MWSVVPTVAHVIMFDHLVTDQWTLDTSLCMVPPLHQVCHLLPAEPVPCGWEGVSHGVPTWRPGLDMDAHMPHLTSESRHPGAGSLPQSSTSAWYSSHHFSGSQICRFSSGCPYLSLSVWLAQWLTQQSCWPGKHFPDQGPSLWAVKHQFYLFLGRWYVLN